MPADLHNPPPTYPSSDLPPPFPDRGWGVFEHVAILGADSVASVSPDPKDPDQGLEAFLKQVPPRWVVYLMADDAGRPVQLLCVKNLRQSLKRRLGTQAPEGTTDKATGKRVNYRDLVRQVFWRRVDSHFEADLVYLQAARAVFPKEYSRLLSLRPAWFVHVNPEAAFPRFIRTQDLHETRSGQDQGQLLGPIEEKGQAAKLIERVESAFDLCRYHSVLTEAPNGKACAYKEMGRCPAPCDGSISMEQYRRMVDLAVRVLVDPGDAIREHEARMRQAAAELKFESAAKIKQYIEELAEFGKGPYRHVRPFSEFRFVAIQKGPREGTAKVYLITQGQVTEEAGLTGEPVSGSTLLRMLLERAERRQTTSTDQEGCERVAIVAGHLLSPRSATGGGSGVFIPLSELEERSFARAYRELMKQKEALPTDPATEEATEGIVREG